MLGHLKSSAQPNYRDFYCGICASLRDEFFFAAALLINNEITLILQALQDFSTWKASKTRCPALLMLKKNPIQIGVLSQKAAQLSLVLAWIKAKDWANDEDFFGKNTLVKYFESKKSTIFISENLQDILEKYIVLLQENNNFEALQRLSGELSQAIFWELANFTNIPKNIANELAQIFNWVGQLILLADHIIDLEEDIKYNKYNGVVENAQKNEIQVSEQKQKVLEQLQYLYVSILQKLNKNELNIDFSTQMKTALQKLWQSVNGKKIVCANSPKSLKIIVQNKDSVCCQCCCQAICDGTCDCICNVCCNDNPHCNNCCDGCCNNCCDGCCDCCDKKDTPPAQDDWTDSDSYNDNYEAPADTAEKASPTPIDETPAPQPSPAPDEPQPPTQPEGKPETPDIF